MKSIGLSIVVMAGMVTALLIIGTGRANGQSKARVNVSFVHTINGEPVVLDTKTYKNCWDESYTVQKLSYYISNISLRSGSEQVTPVEEDPYHLVNEEDTTTKSFSFMVPANEYSSISFLIGVDSLKNVSGAQSGALDPLNGMFWTWNTGYIMFKLEGNSPQSTVVNRKMEYHIGGFSGGNNALRKVDLVFTGGPFTIANESITEIIIKTEVGKIWNGGNELKITSTPVCSTPGQLASRIADNYAKAFEVISIANQ